MEPFKVHKLSSWIAYDEEHVSDGDLADRVRGVLDGSIVAPPPLPDPGPNPQWQALLAAASGNRVLIELIAQHKPHAVCYPATIRWECHGEPASGYEWDYADWPCETTAILARHLGVEVTGA